MLRKIVTTLCLVPLAIVLRRVRGREPAAVTVSLDPFGSDAPALSRRRCRSSSSSCCTLLIGVIVGGVATWLRQGQVAARGAPAR